MPTAGASPPASRDVRMAHARRGRHEPGRRSSPDRSLPADGRHWSSGGDVPAQRPRPEDHDGRDPLPSSRLRRRTGAPGVRAAGPGGPVGARDLAGSRPRRPVTVEEEALARVVRDLEALGIPYMVTGSVASSFHGRPRTTHDADVVIDPTRDTLDRLVDGLAGAGFYVDPDRARDALARRRQFNAIEITSAFKLDLIIRKDRPFSREEFSRRQPVDLPGIPRVALASPEDT